MPAKSRFLASAGDATSTRSSDHNWVSLLHHCSWSNGGQQATTFAMSTFVDDFSWIYEWKSYCPAFFFFSENSVTFFLAEKCREFQLKTFLKVIWSKISGFSFRMVYLLILSWRARRRIYPCDITTFSLFSDCQAPDWEGSQLGLHLVWRWRPLFGLDDLRGLLQP